MLKGLYPKKNIKWTNKSSWIQSTGIFNSVERISLNAVAWNPVEKKRRGKKSVKFYACEINRA